jgi:hypothetical protein
LKLAYIGLNGYGLSTRALDLGDNRSGSLLAGIVVNDNLGSIGSQIKCDGLSYSSRCSRDYRCFSF